MLWGTCTRQTHAELDIMLDSGFASIHHREARQQAMANGASTYASTFIDIDTNFKDIEVDPWSETGEEDMFKTFFCNILC